MSPSSTSPTAAVRAHAHPLNDPGQVAGAYALMLANGIAGFRQMSTCGVVRGGDLWSGPDLDAVLARAQASPAAR